MSCYFRHLGVLLAQAGIEVTVANRKEIDRAFHRIFGVAYKECPATWKKLKAELVDEAKQKELVRKLQTALREEKS